MHGDMTEINVEKLRFCFRENAGQFSHFARRNLPRRVAQRITRSIGPEHQRVAFQLHLLVDQQHGIFREILLHVVGQRDHRRLVDVEVRDLPRGDARAHH